MKTRSPNWIRISFLLFAASLVLHPARYFAGVQYWEKSSLEPLAVAASLAQGHGFSNPFPILHTGPTAILAPAYPLLLAAVLRLSPDGAWAWLVVRWLTTLVVSVQVCTLPWVSRRLGLGAESGLVAAVAWLVAGSCFPAFEQNYSGLLFALVAVPMYRGLKGEWVRWEGTGCALLWGIILLFCPLAILVLLLWWALMLLRRACPALQLALLLLIPMLALSPWEIRNYTVFHRVIPARDNLGLELEISNNSCASFDFGSNLDSGCFSQHHPDLGPEQASLMQKLGEVQYFQQRMTVAKEWIHGHPKAFARLTVLRFFAFWTPTLTEPYLGRLSLALIIHDAVVTLGSLASIIGMVLLWRKNRAAAEVFLCWLSVFPVVYYVTLYGERVRTPILWAILLPAGYVFSTAARALISKTVEPAQFSVSATR
jgi:hypothetical protein